MGICACRCCPKSSLAELTSRNEASSPAGGATSTAFTFSGLPSHPLVRRPNVISYAFFKQLTPVHANNRFLVLLQNSIEVYEEFQIAKSFRPADGTTTANVNAPASSSMATPSSALASPSAASSSGSQTLSSRLSSSSLPLPAPLYTVAISDIKVAVKDERHSEPIFLLVCSSSNDLCFQVTDNSLPASAAHSGSVVRSPSASTAAASGAGSSGAISQRTREERLKVLQVFLDRLSDFSVLVIAGQIDPSTIHTERGKAAFNEQLRLFIQRERTNASKTMIESGHSMLFNYFAPHQLANSGSSVDEKEEDNNFAFHWGAEGSVVVSQFAFKAISTVDKKVQFVEGLADYVAFVLRWHPDIGHPSIFEFVIEDETRVNAFTGSLSPLLRCPKKFHVSSTGAFLKIVNGEEIFEEAVRLSVELEQNEAEKERIRKTLLEQKETAMESVRNEVALMWATWVQAWIYENDPRRKKSAPIANGNAANSNVENIFANECARRRKVVVTDEEDNKKALKIIFDKFGGAPAPSPVSPATPHHRASPSTMAAYLSQKEELKRSKARQVFVYDSLFVCDGIQPHQCSYYKLSESIIINRPDAFLQQLALGGSVALSSESKTASSDKEKSAKIKRDSEKIENLSGDSLDKDKESNKDVVSSAEAFEGKRWLFAWPHIPKLNEISYKSSLYKVYNDESSMLYNALSKKLAGDKTVDLMRVVTERKFLTEPKEEDKDVKRREKKDEEKVNEEKAGKQNKDIPAVPAMAEEKPESEEELKLRALQLIERYHSMLFNHFAYHSFNASANDPSLAKAAKFNWPERGSVAVSQYGFKAFSSADGVSFVEGLAEFIQFDLHWEPVSSSSSSSSNSPAGDELLFTISNESTINSTSAAVTPMSSCPKKFRVHRATGRFLGVDNVNEMFLEIFSKVSEEKKSDPETKQLILSQKEHFTHVIEQEMSLIWCSWVQAWIGDHAKDKTFIRPLNAAPKDTDCLFQRSSDAVKVRRLRRLIESEESENKKALSLLVQQLKQLEKPLPDSYRISHKTAKQAFIYDSLFVGDSLRPIECSFYKLSESIIEYQFPTSGDNILHANSEEAFEGKRWLFEWNDLFVGVATAAVPPSSVSIVEIRQQIFAQTNDEVNELHHSLLNKINGQPATPLLQILRERPLLTIQGIVAATQDQSPTSAPVSAPASASSATADENRV